MKDAIRDFADAWERRDEARGYDGNVDIDWPKRFRDAGYRSVKCKNLDYGNEWQEIHQWCRDRIGEPHYAWTGSTFWFETERDAVLFILRWS